MTLSTEIPFNIAILQITPEMVRSLREVKSTDIMSTTGQRLDLDKIAGNAVLTWQGDDRLSSDFHEDGLFSIQIFGRIGDPIRDKQFSYIDIKTRIFHPVIYKALGKLKKLYLDVLASKAYAIWDEKEKDFVKSNEMDGQTGFNFFVKHWESIQFKETGSPARADRIKLIKTYQSIALTSKILVMPAGLRDVRVGTGSRLENDEINDYYRRLISISKMMNVGKDHPESNALNYGRHLLQKTFNELYERLELLLKDKGGFIQDKWAKRAIFNATRNVITSMDTTKKVLGTPYGPKSTDSIVGLFQAIRGTIPVIINQIRTGFLGEAFGIGDYGTTAQLVNKKTFQREIVDLPSTIKDRYTTIDGLEKIINTYKDPINRHKPMVVEDHYLALIYKSRHGDKWVFRIFNDINELPDHLSREDVSPITLIEFLYLSCYRILNQFKCIITRYPVSGPDSSYPSSLYVRTTVVSEIRYELGPDWEIIGDDYVASEFPTKEPEAFIDSLIISPVRVKGLGADYDGDTCSCLIVYGEESKEEIERILHTREFYIDPKGGLRTSTKVDTVSLVLRNMTGELPTMPY